MELYMWWCVLLFSSDSSGWSELKLPTFSRSISLLHGVAHKMDGPGSIYCISSTMKHHEQSLNIVFIDTKSWCITSSLCVFHRVSFEYLLVQRVNIKTKQYKMELHQSVNAHAYLMCNSITRQYETNICVYSPLRMILYKQRFQNIIQHTECNMFLYFLLYLHFKNPMNSQINDKNIISFNQTISLSHAPTDNKVLLGFVHLGPTTSSATRTSCSSSSQHLPWQCADTNLAWR